MKQKLLVITRWIVGVLFTFSGFVKGIDPIGFQYKLNDYLEALHIQVLGFLSFPGALLLPFAEFVIGITLLSGILIRLSTKLTFLFMLFFTPLTLYIALKNPVTDCGCFGDALVITNWQTFFKNVVLIILAILLFINRKKITYLIPFQFRKVMFAAMTLVYVFIVYRSYNHDPIIDFRPYKVGVNIPDGMKTPKGAPTDVYKSTFYYRNLKSNEIKKFNNDNYPWQDSLNWKYVSMESDLLKKGYRPPIHDFVIQSAEGENIADFFLQDDNYLFIAVAYDLSKSSLKNQKTLNDLAVWAKNQGYKFISLTSSTGNILDKFKANAHPTYDFFFGDEITLKTIIRSNPGLLLLKKGTIIAKWHYNDFPSVEKMKKVINEEKVNLSSMKNK